MKLGIIGLPQAGKKNLYQLVTGKPVSASADKRGEILGVADMRDARFDQLVKMYSPAKVAPARIEIQLLPKIEETTIRDGAIFKDIVSLDAICHLVRGFSDDNIYHLKGSVDPHRDIEFVNAELVLHDLLFIEKRLERIEKSEKKHDAKAAAEEEALLLKLRSHLENDQHLRTLSLGQEEEKAILSYPFITRKQMLIVLNTDDSGADKRDAANELAAAYAPLGLEVMQLAARLEAEIVELDDDAARQEFMADAGIAEPGLNVLSALAIKTLGLISFFTVGEDEVRQWQLKAGSTAPVAAGVIHSDFEHGFIRAEVIKHQDLVSLGSEAEVKKNGKLMVMGKDYIVEDGDVIHFLFNN